MAELARNSRGGSKPGERRGGRKAGTPNKATAGVRALAAKHAPAALDELRRILTSSENDAARVAAARVLLAKVAPDARDRAIQVDLGEVKTPGDALTAISRVLQAMGTGEITPSEASSVVDVIGAFRAAWESTEFEKRLAALEEGR